jgi:hypothetical protein
MTRTISDLKMSADDLRRQYGIALGEAERLISRFSPSSDKLDLLLRAKGRTKLHRRQEFNTSMTRVAYGID